MGYTLQQLQSMGAQPVDPTGVVGGAYLKGGVPGAYATDPQYAQNVKNTYDSIGKILDNPNDPNSISGYIKAKAPQSSITGDMITNASSTYKVDPALLTAVLQHESSFGTLGAGARTNNPGNVGNVDSGAIQQMPDVQSGVLATARELAKRSVGQQKGYTLQQLQQMGAKPYDESQQSGQTLQPDQPKSFLDRIGDIGTSIANFVGGGPLSDFLGTKIAQLGPNGQNVQDTTTPLQALGSAGNVGLTLASLADPEVLGLNAATATGRIGANAALGAGFGATGALASGQTDPGAIAQNTALGITFGGIAGVGGEVGNYLLGQGEKGGLTNSIIGDTLPFRQGSRESAAAFEARQNQIIDTVKGYSSKTVGGMIDEAGNNASSLNGQIDSILNNKYAGNIGNGAKAAEDTLAAFPNSAMDKITDIADSVKNVVPLQEKLVDKVVSGEATLAEKNNLRQAIDQNTYSVRGELPKLTADKKIANTFANNLRNEVQTNAPETSSLFRQESGHIRALKALTQLENRKPGKLVTRGDVAATLGGFMAGGAPGAIALESGKRILSNPSVKITGSKLLQNIGNTRVPQNIGNTAKIVALQQLLKGSNQ